MNYSKQPLKTIQEYKFRPSLEDGLLAMRGASRHLIDATISAFPFVDQDELIASGLAEEENFRGDRVGLRISDQCWHLLDSDQQVDEQAITEAED